MSRPGRTSLDNTAGLVEAIRAASSPEHAAALLRAAVEELGGARRSRHGAVRSSTAPQSARSRRKSQPAQGSAANEKQQLPRAILFGVDTLHLSTKHAAGHEVRARLRARQEELRGLGRAVQAQDAAIIDLAGEPWRVFPFGARDGSGQWTWVLQDEEGTRLLLRDVDHAPKSRAMLVQVSSLALHGHGLRPTADRVVRLLNTLHGSPLPRLLPEDIFLSRVDLCVDYQGWIPTREDFDRSRVVTRSKHDGDWEVADDDARTHRSGAALSSVTFSPGSDVMMRIYDKTRETQASRKKWFVDLWSQSPEYQAAEPTWRVEFQFRREPLVAMGYSTLEALLTPGALTRIWSYATGGGRSSRGPAWFSIRLPDSTRQNRRTIDPRWDVLSSLEWDDAGPQRPPRRQRVRSPQARQYAIQEVAMAACGVAISESAITRMRECGKPEVDPIATAVACYGESVAFASLNPADPAAPSIDLRTGELVSNAPVPSAAARRMVARYALDRRSPVEAMTDVEWRTIRDLEFLERSSLNRRPSAEALTYALQRFGDDVDRATTRLGRRLPSPGARDEQERKPSPPDLASVVDRMRRDLVTLIVETGWDVVSVGGATADRSIDVIATLNRWLGEGVLHRLLLGSNGASVTSAVAPDSAAFAMRMLLELVAVSASERDARLDCAGSDESRWQQILADAPEQFASEVEAAMARIASGVAELERLSGRARLPGWVPPAPVLSAFRRVREWLRDFVAPHAR